MNFLQRLFSTDEFMPHGMCYMWNPAVIWLNVVSDALITLAYYSIPLSLLYFVRKRREFQFNWIFVCFAVFIVACGTTHLMEIVNIWHPTYWLSALIKAITAASSVLTAVLLIRLIPQALSLPSPSALQKAHDETKKELSERKKVEQELHEKNIELQSAAEAKNRFLANMSHELRTPLNGIIGFSELLSDGLPGAVNAEQKEYLGDILTSSEHLLQLINDVLDLAKVEAGKMELHLEPFFLRQAIEEVCTVAQPIVQKKDIRVNTDIAPDLLEVTLDQQKIKQVLYNLLSNAVKFTPEGGIVEIQAALHGSDSFTMTVKDTGIGIKTEDLSRLFREFEQLESGFDRHYEGTGLGLALTRKIVELHGGTIEVESEITKGSTFTVILPLVARKAHP